MTGAGFRVAVNAEGRIATSIGRLRRRHTAASLAAAMPNLTAPAHLKGQRRQSSHVLGSIMATLSLSFRSFNMSAQNQFSSSMALVRRYPVRVSLALIVVVIFLCRPFFAPPSGLPYPHGPATSLEDIPQKIWQIYFGYSPLSDFKDPLQSWIEKNQDCAYTLVSDKGGDRFVQEHYADQPEVLRAFLDLHFPVLRSDFLRYLLLNAAGGAYSDLDTAAIKPFRDWVPPELRSKVRAIVGIEYDQRDDEPYIGMSGTRLQFCQWTMAASPHHPILEKIIASVVKALHALAAKHQTSIHELQPTDDEVVAVTGPTIWTQAVMESLADSTGTSMSYVNITKLKEPTLFGDILILPIDAFGIGQPHSGSTRDGPADHAYIRHLFKGSWKHDWNT